MAHPCISSCTDFLFNMQRILSGKAHILLVLVFLLSTSPNAFGQKVERESRIDAQDVPQPALDYIEVTTLESANWYRETGLESISFEAKFKHKKRWFSVEFSQAGELEDIEIELKLQEIRKDQKERILKYFESEFEKFKVQKVQIQYVEPPLQLLLDEQIPKFDSPHAFEVVVKGRKSKVTELWEFTFDAEGQFISVNQIITRNSTHLEY